jgi:hypothetical protein
MVKLPRSKAGVKALLKQMSQNKEEKEKEKKLVKILKKDFGKLKNAERNLAKLKQIQKNQIILGRKLAPARKVLVKIDQKLVRECEFTI